MTVHTSRLTHARVSDAMHPGVLTCPPEMPMGEVARIMAVNRVHCVVVSYPADRARAAEWGVVSDLDLVAMLAAGDFEKRTAGECAATEPLTISADGRLTEAAQLMRDREVTHLIVLSPASGRPAGILSTLDLARIAAAREA